MAGGYLEDGCGGDLIGVRIGVSIGVEIPYLFCRILLVMMNYGIVMMSPLVAECLYVSSTESKANIPIRRRQHPALSHSKSMAAAS